MHDACLAQMQATCPVVCKCPVCAAPHTNVACTQAIVGITFASRGGCACAAVLGALVLLTVATHTFWLV